MPSAELTNDLDNCIINFDRKVLVTNLLDEYGGLLEEIAKTVNEFLSAEEANGKKFQKTFLLRGLEMNSENEIITIVPEEKLKQQENQLTDARSMLYSAETVGGSKSPPTEFVPLKYMNIKLKSLHVKEVAKAGSNGSVSNGSAPAISKEEKPSAAKKPGALGTMFKKQENSAAAAKKSPEKSTPTKSEGDKKSGALGAMFKKQETAATIKKSPKPEPEKKTNTLGAMFKKQESKKKSPENKKNTEKVDKEKPKPSATKTSPKKEQAKKIKEEPPANVSVNLFEESAPSSSDEEEKLDALKRKVFSDNEEETPTTSSKRRRIIESDDDDSGPEVKVERRESVEEVMEVEDEEPKKSATFMDEDGFVVTVKAKNKKSAPVRKPAQTPVKIKKESPKSPLKPKAGSKTPAAKTKQGNIMNFFSKK